MLDRDLEARTISLISLTTDAIVYEDDRGRRRHATVAGVVAILPAAESYGDERETRVGRARPDSSDAAARPEGYIELVDGQRFPGGHARTSGDQDAILWAHPTFGMLSFGLDRVADVVMDAAIVDRNGGLGDLPIDERVEDEILLTNGDRLSGFLVSLGDPVEIEIDGVTVTIPPERVAAVQLANRAEMLQGIVVWLEDGTVAVVASLDGDRSQGMTIRLDQDHEAQLRTEVLRAVTFDAARLEALANIDPVAQEPIERRLLTEPMRVLSSDDSASELNAPDIELPGPMLVRWNLPEGARRFGAVAEMPMRAMPWGDCELVVYVDGDEIIRRRLNESSPRLDFNIPLGAFDSAKVMEIHVEPGEYGPINDRVILRRPLLLLDNRPQDN